MELLQKLYDALLDASRQGRVASLRESRVGAMLSSLETLAQAAPVAEGLYRAVKAYVDAEQDESLLPPCVLLLRRLQLALFVPAPPPEDYIALPSRLSPPETLSARRLAELRRLIAGGQESEALRAALGDGSAFDPRLLPDWLAALERKALHRAAAFVFAAWGDFARDALTRRAASLSAEGRRLVLDIAAASFPREEKLPYLRESIAGDTETRCHALGLLGAHSEERADAACIVGCLNDDETREAALEALRHMSIPEAGQALLRDAESCLAAQDFTRLQSVLCRIAERGADANRAEYYRFCTRLLPLLICRPGNHIWLVQTCTDMIADSGRAEGITFLEEMLSLARSRCAG